MRDRIIWLCGVLTGLLIALLLWSLTPVVDAQSVRINGVQSFANPVAMANGASTGPGLAFVGSPYDGWYWRSLGHITFAAQATPSIDFGPGLGFGNTSITCWAPNGNLAGSIDGNLMDTGIGRLAAGVLAIVDCDNATGTGSAIDLGDPGAQPTCAVGFRGTIWIDEGTAGVKDSVAVCAKDAANAYAWRTIY